MMTIEELLEKIEAIRIADADKESSHCELDDLLLEYIGDERVTKAFNDIDKWYA